MSHRTPIRNSRHGEEGYLLVWVVFMLFIFALWLSVAVPRTAKEIQRDRELETMRRGKQYIRAVQLYFRKFHAYPPNANALVNTNQIRFLRKKYIDPTTHKDDWRPIRYGSTKTQTLGFFGQPIAGAGSAAGSVVAGVGPSGNGGLGGSSIGSGSGFGGSSIFSPSGSSSSSISPGTSTTTGTTGTTGSSGTGSTGSSSSFGSSDQSTFGGVGIVGFSPASTATSILIYKKKQHYNEWEFTYDPLTDIQTQSGNSGAIGQPVGSSSTSGSSSSSSSNSSTSGSNSNSSSNSSTSGSGSGSGSGSNSTTNSTSTN